MAIHSKNTFARVTVCLLLAGATAAHAAELSLEITEQPRAIERPEVVDIEWAGEAAQVFVEHRHGLE